jgi:hypothetical protein
MPSAILFRVVLFFIFFFLTPIYGSLITVNAKRLCQKANYPRVDAAPVGKA